MPYTILCIYNMYICTAYPCVSMRHVICILYLTHTHIHTHIIYIHIIYNMSLILYIICILYLTHTHMSHRCISVTHVLTHIYTYYTWHTRPHCRIYTYYTYVHHMYIHMYIHIYMWWTHIIPGTRAPTAALQRSTQRSRGICDMCVCEHLHTSDASVRHVCVCVCVWEREIHRWDMCVC